MMRTWSVTLTEHVEKCAVILKNARKLTDDRPLFRPLHYTLNVYLLFRHLRMYKQTKSLHMKHLEWFKLKAQGMSINCQLPLMMCLTHGLETHCMHIRMYVSKIYVCMYVRMYTRSQVGWQTQLQHITVFLLYRITIQVSYVWMHMVSMAKQLAIDSHFELYDFTQ